jgi:hypothetical protein
VVSYVLPYSSVLFKICNLYAENLVVCFNIPCVVLMLNS